MFEVAHKSAFDTEVLSTWLQYLIAIAWRFADSLPVYILWAISVWFALLAIRQTLAMRQLRPIDHYNELDKID